MKFFDDLAEHIRRKRVQRLEAELAGTEATLTELRKLQERLKHGVYFDEIANLTGCVAKLKKQIEHVKS